MLRPRVQLRISGSYQWAVDRASDDLARSMPARRVVQNTIDRQWPVLHQSVQVIPLFAANLRLRSGVDNHPTGGFSPPNRGHWWHSTARLPNGGCDTSHWEIAARDACSRH